MRKFTRLTLFLVLILILSLFTQIGGILLILCLPIFNFFKKKFENPFLRASANFFSYVFIYLFCSILVVPHLAPYFGRVPLPSFNLKKEDSVRPLTSMTCILNRHYTTPELSAIVINSAKRMQEKYPNSTINYLDANFPFFNGFPLIPHLSHNDGKKIDVAFYYTTISTNEETNETPSPIGYGIYESPRINEINTAEECKEKGFFQYNLIGKFIPKQIPSKFEFDPMRTKYLIEIFVNNTHVNKVFIEPHLKKRLSLEKYSKIRFHGCHAVRHDDHIHVEL